MCRLLRWPPDSHQERVHGVLSVLLADASRNIYNIISTPCHDVLQQPVGTLHLCLPAAAAATLTGLVASAVAAPVFSSAAAIFLDFCL